MPRKGQHHSAEARARMSAVRKGRPGHPHTDADRQRISEGNARSIQNRTRTYRFHVSSPCGGTVPCRSSREQSLALHLCATPGVRSVVGEDQLEFIPYTLAGQRRLTVPDFLVTRDDGVQVLVEAKSQTSFYKARDRARVLALWAWAQERCMPFLLSLNSKPLPSVWTGPFVTEAFMEGVRQKRVRVRTMRTVAPLGDAVPSACALPTYPPSSTLIG